MENNQIVSVNKTDIQNTTDSTIAVVKGIKKLSTALNIDEAIIFNNIKNHNQNLHKLSKAIEIGSEGISTKLGIELLENVSPENTQLLPSVLKLSTANLPLSDGFTNKHEHTPEELDIRRTWSALRVAVQYFHNYVKITNTKNVQVNKQHIENSYTTTLNLDRPSDAILKEAILDSDATFLLMVGKNTVNTEGTIRTILKGAEVNPKALIHLFEQFAEQFGEMCGNNYELGINYKAH